MNDQDRRALLIGYLEDDLPPAEMERVRSWLSEDEELAGEFKLLQGIDSQLTSIADGAYAATGLERLSLLDPKDWARVNGREPDFSSGEVALPKTGKARVLDVIRRQWLAAAASMLFIATAASMWFQKDETPRAVPPVATVMQASGTKFQQFDKVFQGQWIEIADGEMVRLQPGSGVDIRVAGTARFMFDSSMNATQESGDVVVQVAPGSEKFSLQYGGFNLSTSTGLYEIKDEALEVRSGLVTITNKDGLEQTLRPGDTKSLAAGGAALKGPPRRAGTNGSPPGSNPGGDQQAMASFLELSPAELSAFLPKDSYAWVVVKDRQEVLFTARQFLRLDPMLMKIMPATFDGMGAMALGFTPRDSLPVIVAQMKDAESRLETLLAAAHSMGLVRESVLENWAAGKLYSVSLQTGDRRGATGERRYVGAVGDCFYFAPTAEDVALFAGSEKLEIIQRELYQDSIAWADDAPVFFALDLPLLARTFSERDPRRWPALESLGLGDIGPLFLRGTREGVSLLLEGMLRREAARGLLSQFHSPSTNELLALFPARSMFAVNARFDDLRATWGKFLGYLLDAAYHGDEQTMLGQLGELNDTLGFDVPADLLPTLGEDFAFGWFLDGAGDPSWLLAWQASEPRQLETLMTRAFQTKGDAPSPAALHWQVEDGMLLLGSSGRTLQEALARRGAPSLRTDQRLVTLAEGGASSDAMIFLDLGPLTSLFAGGPVALPRPESYPMAFRLASEGDFYAVKGLLPGDGGMVFALSWLIQGPRGYVAGVSRQTESVRNNLTRLAEHLRTFHGRHGRLPTDLHELHRESPDMLFIPEDLFAGAGAHPGYALDEEEGTIRVWSLGPDRRDDNGLRPYDKGRGILSDGDIIVKIGVAQ